jgi:hypothetical protein
MSGLGGHMPHIHEDYNLTFSQVKKILTELSTGATRGTEKLDGQNLYISYSFAEGCAKAARNKTNIDNGGMTSSELANKFSGRGDIESSFNDAFSRFEKVVSLMTEEEKEQVFGRNADVYYNVEILDPRTRNIIEYNTKSLVVHRSNHIVCKGHANFLALETAFARVKSSRFGVVVNQERTIEDMGNSFLSPYLDEIDNLQETAGLTENSTIAEYFIKNCLQSVMELGLQKEKSAQILKRLVTRKVPHLNEIKKGLTSEEKKQVSALIQDRSFSRNAILPLEKVVHGFSVAVLKEFRSGYSSNSGGRDLYERFQTARDKIESSPYDKAREILSLNLSKISKPEEVIFETEGFVFPHGNSVYKITGNFAPVNQILGLFTFGRGEVPPLKESAEDSPVQKIAVFPGAFKPPHMGHIMVIDHLLSNEGVDKVVVLISDPSNPKSQRSISKQRDISAQDAKEIFDKMLHGRPGVEIRISASSSPVTSMFDYIGEDGDAPKDATIILASSDKEDDASRFRSVQKYAREDLDVASVAIPAFKHSSSYLHNLSQDKKVLNNLPSMVGSGDPKKFHASDMRYLISLAQEGNETALFLLKDFLPENVIEYVLRLFSVDLSEDFQSKMKKRLSQAHSRLLDQGGQKNSTPYEKKRDKDKSNAFLAKEEDELEEISAMAGGSVAGYSAPLATKKKKKKKKFP